VTAAAKETFSAFPSGHCGLSILAVILARKINLHPKYTYVVGITTVLITLATQVLRYHYFVDFLFSLPIVVFACWFGGFHSSHVYEENLVCMGLEEYDEESGKPTMMDDLDITALHAHDYSLSHTHTHGLSHMNMNMNMNSHSHSLSPRAATDDAAQPLLMLGMNKNMSMSMTSLSSINENNANEGNMNMNMNIQLEEIRHANAKSASTAIVRSSSLGGLAKLGMEAERDRDTSI